MVEVGEIAPGLHYSIGITFSEDDKDVLKKMVPLIELQEISEFSGSLEERITHLARIDGFVVIYLFFKEISKEKIDKLKVILFNKFFLEQRGKIIIKIAYIKIGDEQNNTFNNFLSSLKKQGLYFDLYPLTYNKANETTSLKTSDLGLLQFHYDYEATSGKMIRTKKGNLPVELSKAAKAEGLIPEKYWYWNERSAILWQQVVDSDEYAISQITTNLLKEHMAEIVDAVSCDYSERIDFIDLGIGTPEKDKIILTALMDKIKNKAQSRIVYYPIDISFPLMEGTLKPILSLKGEFDSDKQYQSSLIIVPILGDFDKLNRPSYQKILCGDRPKLIALLGNTLGNFVEEDLFNKLKPILRGKCDGYLLVDIEFAEKYSEKEHQNNLLKQYENDAVFEFARNPLELLLEGEKPNEVNRTVNDKIQVHLETITKRKKVIEWSYGKTQSKIITSIPNSKVVYLLYKYHAQIAPGFANSSETSPQEILLLWSTRYTRSEFEKYVIDNGFEFCELDYKNQNDIDEQFTNCWTDKNHQCGLYLLKLKNP